MRSDRLIDSDLDLLLIRSNGGGSNSDLAAQVAVLKANSVRDLITPPALITNLLRNSDFDHSGTSYPDGGGDDDLAWWYYAVNGIGNTFSRVTIATDPEWDRTNGQVLWTALTNDLCYNFPARIIKPGLTMSVMFLARLTSAAVVKNLQLTVGFWDQTLGDWITGTLIGTALGAPVVTVTGGAATAYTYKVVANIDDGSVIVSAVASTAAGPTTLDGTHFNTITWLGITGATNYRIYRLTGSTAGLVGQTQGATSFNDQGQMLSAAATPPQADPPQAKATIRNLDGALAFPTWTLIRATVRVPGSYAIGNTGAGAQWFRMQLTGDAPAVPINIDRVGVSLSSGLWAANASDLTTALDFPGGGGGDDGIGTLGTKNPWHDGLDLPFNAELGFPPSLS